MADIKLILSDIDGTILNDKNVADSDLKKNIIELNRRKIPFVLASARSPRGMLTLAKELGVMDNPIVCYNGALVVKNIQSSDYRTILSHGLNLSEVRQIFQILQKNFPEISINLYSGADWYVENLDKWVKIEADITNMTPIVTDLNQLVDKLEIPIHKLLLIGEPSEISQVMNYLRSANIVGSSFYLSKDNYLEITADKVSKEHALRELADYYQISLGNTMTLGDNFNDVPMLDLAKVGVAMDNAPVDVKVHADFVTKSNNENGVSYAIEKYVLKR